jgi:hypothetical protein
MEKHAGIEDLSGYEIINNTSLSKHPKCVNKAFLCSRNPVQWRHELP